MDIGSVLSRAWQTIWKHKVLWIFGILAGCSGSGNNVLNYQLRSQREIPQEMQQFFNQFPRLPDWQITMLIIILIGVALVITVLVIFLGTIGRVGLIRGTFDVDRGATRLAFGELFSESLRYFWRVFGLNLLVGLVAFFVAMAVAIFVVLGSVITLGIGAICLVPLLCLLVPLGWIVAVIVEQANIAIVVENLGIVAGLQRGWEVFRNNLGPVIVMALILMLGVSLIGGSIIGLPLIFIIVPAVFGAMSNTPQVASGGWLVAGLCLVAYLPVLILLNGILRGFVESAWTLTFLDLTRRPTSLVVEPTPLA